MREIHQSVAYHTCPNRGWNWQPRCVPARSKPAAFWYTGWMMLHQLSQLARAIVNIFHVVKFHLYILSGEMSVHIFCLFSHWIVCFLNVLRVFFNIV